MPTPKQEKLAEAIVENLTLDKPKTKQQLLESSGYTPATAKASAAVIIEQKGVQEALMVRGFTEDNAKRVVSDLMLDEEQDGNVRLKAADMTFKVHGSYAAEKQEVRSVSVEGSPQDYVEAEKLRIEYEEKMKKLLLGQ